MAIGTWCIPHPPTTVNGHPARSLALEREIRGTWRISRATYCHDSHDSVPADQIYSYNISSCVSSLSMWLWVDQINGGLFAQGHAPVPKRMPVKHWSTWKIMAMHRTCTGRWVWRPQPHKTVSATNNTSPCIWKGVSVTLYLKWQIHPFISKGTNTHSILEEINTFYQVTDPR